MRSMLAILALLDCAPPADNGRVALVDTAPSEDGWRLDAPATCDAATRVAHANVSGGWSETYTDVAPETPSAVNPGAVTLAGPFAPRRRIAYAP